MRKEIRITGLGGQGAITAGNILARAAVLYDQKEAVLTEGYSPYVTGGWSRADIIIQEEKIDFPLVSKLDVLVSMYQEGLDQNYRMIKSGGVALAETRLVSVNANLKRTGDKRILLIPAATEAEKLGKKMVTNIVLLGSLEAIAPVVNIESLNKALVDRFPKAAEMNMKAIASGYELGLKAMKEQEGQVQIA
jgi:2-oxoglutarate ferredoxin oxidoreductase subunit gamma